MCSDTSSGSKLRAKRAKKGLFLTACFVIMIGIPFLPVVYPDSAVIQLFFGRGRFILIYLVLVFILLPFGLKQLEQQRRYKSDQQRKEK